MSIDHSQERGFPPPQSVRPEMPRRRGQMLWFNEERGSGLILSDDGERVTVDRSGFASGGAPVGRCAGKQVSFAQEPAGGEHGPRAVHVTMLEEDSPRRARLRRQNTTPR